MSTRRSSSAASAQDAGTATPQWVMITHERNLKTATDVECRPTICKLRNPKSGEAAMYMFTDGDRRVHEVMTFDEDGQRSWFIDNTVQTNGSMLVTTPVDPLFLILPYLIQAAKTGKYMSLDCLLVDSDLPECRRLSSCCSVEDVAAVAESKGSGDCSVFRYDSTKALSWLKQKVDRLLVSLQQEQVTVDASVATFVKSKRSSEVNRDEHLLFAAGLISDYVPPDVAQQLTDALGIKSEVTNYACDDSPLLKKAKLEPLTPLEDYSVHGITLTNKKSEKTTLAQKKLSKVDKTGIKSISSFFSAKPAAK